MSINQSQPRMRLHPILLHSRFHQKPAASPGFSGCSVLASLRRVLQVAREACSTPEPRICAESSPSFGFLSPFFLLTKTTTCPPSHTFRETFIVHLETFRGTLETFRETFRETPTPPSRPTSSGGPQLCFHFNYLNPNYHAAAGERFMVEALKKEPMGPRSQKKIHNRSIGR